MGDLESEPTDSCKEERLKVEVLGHQPDKTLPYTLGPSYQRCWGQGGLESVGVSKECLVHLEAHAMKGSPHLTLPRDPEAGEPSDLGEKIIPNDILL